MQNWVLTGSDHAMSECFLSHSKWHFWQIEQYITLMFFYIWDMNLFRLLHRYLNSFTPSLGRRISEKFCYESQRRYEYSLTGTMLHCNNQLNCPWSLLHPHELRGQFLKFRSILSYKGIVRASSRNSLAKSSFIKKYGHSSRVSLHFEPMVWMSGCFWLIESSFILRTIYVCLSGHDQL